jgi:hypothetical protein
VSPFGKLFWGFLIVLIDVRINGFDLLVDLAGFILIVIGLAELARRNPIFGRARPYATALLGLSAFDLFTRTSAGNSGLLLFGSAGLAFAFLIALAVVNLMLVYLICRGIGEMARASGAVELADLSVTRWQFFLFTYVLSTVLVIVAATSDSAFGALALVSIIVSLVAAILFAGLLRRADKAFYPRGV